MAVDSGTTRLFVAFRFSKAITNHDHVPTLTQKNFHDLFLGNKTRIHCLLFYKSNFDIDLIEF